LTRQFYNVYINLFIEAHKMSDFEDRLLELHNDPDFQEKSRTWLDANLPKPLDPELEKAVEDSASLIKKHAEIYISKKQNERPCNIEIPLEHRNENGVCSFSELELLGIYRVLQDFRAYGWEIILFEPEHPGGCPSIPPRIFLEKR
jgi:hypothetical protein